MSTSSPPASRDRDDMAVVDAWDRHKQSIERADNPRAVAVHIEPVLDELAYAVRDRDASLADSRRADAWLAFLADVQPAFTEAALRDWLADRLRAIEAGAGATDE